MNANTNEAIDDIDNNALLSLIGDALVPSDVTGPPILEHLANIVDAKFTAEFDIDKRKEILDKYKVPKNCNSLFTPKVNPEIWGKLPSFVRRNDVRASTRQDTLLRVTGAISSSIEDLWKACEEKQTPEYKAIIATLFDAIAILGHFNKELSFKRREALKPNLSNEFKQNAIHSKATQLPTTTTTVSKEEVYKKLENFNKQRFLPHNSISKEHHEQVDIEIGSLLQKGVIVKCEHEPGEFISPIFTVPKNDGNVRLILNLKEFNKNVKMEIAFQNGDNPLDPKVGLTRVLDGLC
eukprot:gene14535-16038_t